MEVDANPYNVDWSKLCSIPAHAAAAENPVASVFQVLQAKPNSGKEDADPRSQMEDLPLLIITRLSQIGLRDRPDPACMAVNYSYTRRSFVVRMPCSYDLILKADPQRSPFTFFAPDATYLLTLAEDSMEVHKRKRDTGSNWGLASYDIASTATDEDFKLAVSTRLREAGLRFGRAALGV